MAVKDDISYIPPDTTGAVGPNHVMTTLNNQVNIQTRSGGAIVGYPKNLSSFWAGTGTSFTDPKVLYDPYAGRWIAIVDADFDQATPKIALAVTTGATPSDPTGTWFRFTVVDDPTGAAWCDYPTLGFNKDWIVVSCNMFSNSNNFAGVWVYTFHKATLYAGSADTATVTKFSTSSGGTIQPAVTYDATAAEYLFQSWNGNSGAARLYTVTGSGTISAVSLVTQGQTWAFAAGSNEDFAPQQGSSDLINTGDDRMINVVYRNGSIWGVQTAFIPASAPTRSVAQYWQVSPGGLLQAFGRAGSGASTFYGYPSIAVNKNGDALIGYSSFSTAQFASAAYTYRHADGTVEPDVVLKAGKDSYHKTYDPNPASARNRWGDYSNTVIDPVNDTDFWTIQEYAETHVNSASCFPDSRCDIWSTWWGQVLAPATAAIAQPSPASLTFASQKVGTTSPAQTVTITNTGGSNLSISAVARSGSNSNDFSSSGETCTGASVPPGGTCQIPVRFTPSATGARTASVDVTSNAAPVAIAASGTGIQAALGLSQPSLSFGQQAVGTPSSVLTETVTNTGTASMAIGTVTVGGTNAADFSTTSDSCSGGTVAPGATCSIGMRFTPGATGARAATLAIPDDAPGAPHTVPLSGTGVTNAPGLSLSVSSIDFGQQSVGTTSGARTLTVTSSGTAPLSLGTITIGGTNSSDYAKLADACSGVSLAPAAQCQVSFVFTPGAQGSRSASASIASNAGPATVTLLGTGVVTTTASLTPSSLTFATFTVGVTSPSQSITVRNTGTSDLLVSTAFTSGDFALISDLCSGRTVHAGATCSLAVTFTPRAAGTRTGSLTVASNATGSPHVASLSGTGAGPAVTVTDGNFGDQTIGVPSSVKALTVRNVSTASLTVGAATFSGAAASDFMLSSDACSGRVLGAGATCALGVVFTPSAPGARAATISVTHSGAGSPATASLTGTGLAPVIALSPSSVSFPVTKKGMGQPAQRITITNTGRGTLVNLALQITGDNAADFRLAGTTCTAPSYVSGQSCTVDVGFTAGGDGARTARLAMVSNAPAPTNLPLEGVGDGIAPVSRFSTAPNSILVGGSGRITGSTSDATAGVSSVAVTLASATGSQTQTPTLGCNAARTVCTWSATAPLVPGVYTVTARGTDKVGNAESPGASITVFVL